MRSAAARVRRGGRSAATGSAANVGHRGWSAVRGAPPCPAPIPAFGIGASDGAPCPSAIGDGAGEGLGEMLPMGETCGVGHRHRYCRSVWAYGVRRRMMVTGEATDAASASGSASARCRCYMRHRMRSWCRRRSRGRIGLLRLGSRMRCRTRLRRRLAWCLGSRRRGYDRLVFMVPALTELCSAFRLDTTLYSTLELVLDKLDICYLSMRRRRNQKRRRRG